MSSVNNSNELAPVMVHPSVQLRHRCAVSVAKGVMRTTQATKALVTGCNLNWPTAAYVQARPPHTSENASSKKAHHPVREQPEQQVSRWLLMAAQTV